MQAEIVMSIIVAVTSLTVFVYILYDAKRRKQNASELKLVANKQDHSIEISENIEYKIDGIHESIKSVGEKIDAFAVLITQSFILEELSRTKFGYTSIRNNGSAFVIPFADDEAETISDFVLIDYKDIHNSFEIKSVYASLPEDQVDMKMVKLVSQVNLGANGGNYLIEWIGDKAYLTFSQRMYSDIFGVKSEKLADLITHVRMVHKYLSEFIGFKKDASNSPNLENYLKESNKVFAYVRGLDKYGDMNSNKTDENAVNKSAK